MHRLPGGRHLQSLPLFPILGGAVLCQTKYILYFITALFCAFLGGMLVASPLLPDKEMSELENRYLQQLPNLSVETVTERHLYGTGRGLCGRPYRRPGLLGGRQSLVVSVCPASRRTTGSISVSRTPSSNRVEPPPGRIPPLRRAFPPSMGYLTRLGFVDTLAGNVSVPVYFGLIPSSAAIWADRLPDGAPTRRRDVPH